MSNTSKTSSQTKEAGHKDCILFEPRQPVPSKLILGAGAWDSDLAEEGCLSKLSSFLF